jgi:hypothetical protein
MQYAKDDLQAISTDGGVIIDFKSDREKPDSSIRFKFESFSDIVDSSDVHTSKHDLEHPLYFS